MSATTDPPVVPNPPEIRDVVPPIPADALPVWVPVVGGILVVVAVGFALWWFLFRRSPEAPPPSLVDVALAELDGLARDGAGQTPHDFAIGVSDVLRRFFQEYYDLPATRQTSPEFLAHVTTHREVPGRFHGPLSEFLGAVDRAKFAVGDGGDIDRERLIETARSLVVSARSGAGGEVAA